MIAPGGGVSRVVGALGGEGDHPVDGERLAEAAISAVTSTRS